MKFALATITIVAASAKCLPVGTCCGVGVDLPKKCLSCCNRISHRSGLACGGIDIVLVTGHRCGAALSNSTIENEIVAVASKSIDATSTAECGSDKYERRFAQCGGSGYKGETCCPAGWSCTAQSKYYSQCESIAPPSPQPLHTGLGKDFLDTVTADVLLQEPPRDMAAPTDLEVEAQGDACLVQVNKYRATKNLAALRMNSGKNSCAGGQAAKDGPGLTPHAHAGECGESGQCESAGQSSCAASIQGYFGEGPGGAHYNIIMDPRYRSMAYGHKDIGGKYRTWWTQDFFTSSSEDTIVEAAVESNSTVDGKGTCCKCSSSADCSGSMTCCPHMHKCIKSESTACYTDRDCHPANTVASITV